MSKVFSTRIRVYVVFLSKSPPFRIRPMGTEHYRRRISQRQIERESCSRKTFPGTRKVNTRSQPRSKGRQETLGTNGNEVSLRLRWLYKVLAVCEYM